MSTGTAGRISTSAGGTPSTWSASFDDAGTVTEKLTGRPTFITPSASRWSTRRTTTTYRHPVTGSSACLRQRWWPRCSWQRWYPECQRLRRRRCHFWRHQRHRVLLRRRCRVGVDDRSCPDSFRQRLRPRAIVLVIDNRL